MSKKKTGVFTKPGSPERRKTAPPSQTHKKEKGAGSYDRKKESTYKDEPITEEHALGLFIDCIDEKNYSDAYKYLSRVVEGKLKDKIEAEYQLPIF